MSLIFLSEARPGRDVDREILQTKQGRSRHVQEADDADVDEQVAEDEDETSETIFAKSTAKRRRAQSASGPTKRVKVAVTASAVSPVKKTALGKACRHAVRWQ